MSEEAQEEATEETEVAGQEGQEAQEASDGESNPLYDALFKTVEGEPSAEPEEEAEAFTPPSSLQEALYDINHGDEVSEVEEPEAEAEGDDAKARPKSKSKPKPKVRVAPKVVDPEFSPAPRPKQPRREMPVAEDDPFVKELNPEELERYKLAKWASQNVQGQEKLADEYLTFFKNHKDYISKRLDEEPDAELGNDADYKRFVDTYRPGVNVKDLEREKWTQEAEGRAMRRMQPEIQRLQLEQRRIQNSPLAAQGLQESKRLLMEAVPEDMRKELSENSEEYAKKNPFEVNIINTQLQSGLALSKAFYDILYELEEYNERNPTHRALNDFINNEQERFIQSGRTKRNGKTFVRRERYPHVPEAEREKYYTFTDSDIAKMIAARTKSSVEAELNQMRNQFAAAGYTRNGVAIPQEQVQPAEPQQNTARPIQPTPMAGAAMPAPKGQGSAGSTVLSLLDM